MIKTLKGCIPYLVLGALCLACAFILDFTNAVILNYRVGLILSFVLGIVVISVLVYKKIKDNLSLQKLFLYLAGALICIGSTFLLTQFNRGALLVIISGFLWVFYIGVVLYCEGKLSEKNIVLLIFFSVVYFKVRIYCLHALQCKTARRLQLLRRRFRFGTRKIHSMVFQGIKVTRF